MEEAERLCDRIAIMDHGRLLAPDTPNALKRSLAGDTEVRVECVETPKDSRPRSPAGSGPVTAGPPCAAPSPWSCPT
jgi:ABC-2 type transport system ATP-binding protein